MQLSRYYRKLGLAPGASEAEVRKHYRKLAMQYHPDKNPTVAAARKFIDITEAYEILTGKRAATTSPVRKSRSTFKKSQEDVSNEERMKEAKQRYYEQVAKEHIENEKYYANLTRGPKWMTMRVSAIVGVICAFLLLIDLFLPNHYEEDVVTHYALNAGFGGNNEQLTAIKTKKDASYWVSKVNYNLYGRHPRIVVQRTWIFHEPVHIIARGKLRDHFFNAHYTIYSNQLVVSLVFLIPLFTLFYKRRNVSFTVLYHLSYYGVNAVIIWFLLTNDHWLHLLTAGFV